MSSPFSSAANILSRCRPIIVRSLPDRSLAMVCSASAKLPRAYPPSSSVSICIPFAENGGEQGRWLIRGASIREGTCDTHRAKDSQRENTNEQKNELGGTTELQRERSASMRGEDLG